MIIRFELSI